MSNKLIIAIDFDGTCVTHEYPKVGKDVGAVPVLKRLVAEGHRLMLWTMRGNKPTQDDGDSVVNTLAEAVEWFKDNGIQLWGINENPEQKASGWTNSNKQYARCILMMQHWVVHCCKSMSGDQSHKELKQQLMVKTLNKYLSEDHSLIGKR